MKGRGNAKYATMGESRVKALLVVDGSSNSEVAARMLTALRPHSESETAILTVVPEATFLGGITLDAFRGSSEARKKARAAQRVEASKLLERTARILTDGKSNIETLVRWGNPSEEILSEAAQRSASLIIMGAKGLTHPLRFRLGSVAIEVMKHARASVLLVRPKAAAGVQESGKTSAPGRVLFASDGSKYADATAKLLLELPLPRQTEVIVVTTVQSHLEVWMKTPTLDFLANQEILAKLQAAEEDEARKITAKSQKLFRDGGYRTASVVVRGEASECILAAAQEYKPDIVVVGSKGLNSMESFLLGSVAERVARYADCSVLIGRAARK